jgi:hypothetical protein
LVTLGAEEVANEALTQARQRLANVDGGFTVGLVVADDLKGGWTNRYLTEMAKKRADKSCSNKRVCDQPLEMRQAFSSK